ACREREDGRGRSDQGRPPRLVGPEAEEGGEILAPRQGRPDEEEPQGRGGQAVVFQEPVVPRIARRRFARRRTGAYQRQLAPGRRRGDRRGLVQFEIQGQFKVGIHAPTPTIHVGMQRSSFAAESGRWLRGWATLRKP